MRSILIILFFILTIVSLKSYGQKWMAGRFTDVKGNVETGFIRFGSGKAPIKGEAFIEFKEDKKAEPFKLSASDLKSFVIARDSFVVAHAPGNETWAHNDFDFVRVVLDEDIKLYAAGGVKTGSGGGGISIDPGIGAGVGTGGIGAGVGGGVSIPIGRGGGGTYQKQVYYYGDNPAHMKRLNDKNFEDIMCDMMGDFPDIVDKIHAKVYILENIDTLIAYFKQVKAEGKTTVTSITN
ncbi:hypothetical protein [Mucilaginibacter sp.]|uniref:hypothetical protein n=1 Tax=Mucilaginibacter sp. TaxID=1882438 RepID=UPI002845C552|nr:hypothetical protein [Mucilaginibacter sp.]MDR3694856.1 hypothetical protein [Mucilaginibacter sp.]